MTLQPLQCDDANAGDELQVLRRCTALLLTVAAGRCAQRPHPPEAEATAGPRVAALLPGPDPRSHRRLLLRRLVVVVVVLTVLTGRALGVAARALHQVSRCRLLHCAALTLWGFLRSLVSLSFNSGGSSTELDDPAETSGVVVEVGGCAVRGGGCPELRCRWPWLEARCSRLPACLLAWCRAGG